MSEETPERTVWFNGRFVPESQALVPYRDRSFYFGDGCFDLTRSFGHALFFVEDHVARLFRSLRYLKIDIGMTPEEMARITREVFERNRPLLGENEDYWVGQRISRGVHAVAGDRWPHRGPNVVVECLPIPFRERASQFRDGARVLVPSVRRTPPDCLSPRVKSHNYLNLIMGDLEVKARDPEAWAVLLDQAGNLCEGIGSNIFIVKDGVVRTPAERFVLPGVSRGLVFDFARDLGLPAAEGDIDLYDAYNAEEAFITSTSLCIMPVVSFNDRPVGDGKAFGPVTRQLAEAYKAHVGFDFVGQYLSHLT